MWVDNKITWQPKDFPVVFRMYQLNLDGHVFSKRTRYTCRNKTLVRFQIFCYTIVNDITNFCFRFLPKPYTGAFAGPKTKFLMSLTIESIQSVKYINVLWRFCSRPQRKTLRNEGKYDKMIIILRIPVFMRLKSYDGIA